MLRKISPTIAFIDSGIGGISVLKRLIDKFHVGNFIYFADNRYMPYGNKSNKFLSNRLNEIISLLQDKYKADIVILACNTASSVIQTKNDDVYPIQFNFSQVYLTTPLTKKNLPHLNIIADKNLANIIEKNIFDSQKLESQINSHIQRLGLNKLDNLVLGCTHYELVEGIFKKLCPNTEILLNSDSIIDKIRYVPNNSELNIKVLLSKYSKVYEDNVWKLIGG